MAGVVPWLSDHLLRQLKMKGSETEWSNSSNAAEIKQYAPSLLQAELRETNESGCMGDQGDQVQHTQSVGQRANSTRTWAKRHPHTDVLDSSTHRLDLRQVTSIQYTVV